MKLFRDIVSTLFSFLLLIVLLAEVQTYKYYNTNLHNYTINDITKIIVKLQKVSRYPLVDKKLTVIILPVLDPNAAATEDKQHNPVIYVTQGMLNLVHTEDELANVLGHEWAHYALRHTNDLNHIYLDYPVVAEYYADLMGQQFVNLAGYDPAEAATLWKHFIVIYGPNYEDVGNHPGISARYVYTHHNYQSLYADLHIFVYPFVNKINYRVVSYLNKFVGYNHGRVAG